jgi:hypothetical protein
MDDTDELIIRLCTQAGMIMEDTSILALTVRGVPPPARAAAIANICRATETIDRLMEAARSLRR